jgi:hypothetical protein
MSQTSRFTRARQLTSTVLPGRRVDGYADQVTGRLRRIAAARSTGLLPFSGRSDGSIYFRDGKVAFAESTRWPGTISSASRTTSRSEGPGRRTSLSGPSRHPHGPADQWMAKSARVYPSALTVGWMKLFSIIRVACASAALISGPVTFGFCLTCVNARFCAWP